MYRIDPKSGRAIHVPTHMLNDAGYVSSPMQRAGLAPEPWYYMTLFNPNNLAPVPLTFSNLPIYTVHR